MSRIHAAVFWPGFKPFFLTVWLVFAVFTVLGQTPPPNDNFSNSITLTGTDIIFSGSLAGATIENYNETLPYQEYFYTENLGALQSIWWNWTAPASTTLTLQILNPSGRNVLAVYNATNGTPLSGLGAPIGFMPTFYQIAPLTLSVPVGAGSNYQLQLIGNCSATFTIRLIATNTPAIITQPRSQTVYSNAAALFYVVSAGTNQPSFSFQWSLNGTNIPGAIAAMLPLTNIDSTMAGAYTVAVSNSAGASISQPAILTVSQSNFPVSLSATGVASNAFTFSVAGEPGRSYRLQCSTNFINWIPAVDFPEGPFAPTDLTSVFWETNDSEVLTVTNSQPTEFFRVTPYIISDPDAQICINNLEQIRVAKLLWQRNFANTNTTSGNIFGNNDPTYPIVTALPLDTDIAPYFPNGVLPHCPEDSTSNFRNSYGSQNLQLVPVCFINSTNHVLEDPQ